MSSTESDAYAQSVIATLQRIRDQLAQAIAESKCILQSLPLKGPAESHPPADSDRSGQ